MTTTLPRFHASTLLLLCALCVLCGQPLRAEVNSAVDHISYAGNGSTKTFTVPFGVFSTTELSVICRTDATGDEDPQTINSDYTATDNDSDGDWWDGTPGGSITFTTAPASGVTVWVERVPPLTQTTDLDGSAYVRLSSLEDAVDKLATRDQYLYGRTVRSLLAPATDRGEVDMNLPAGWSESSGSPWWDATAGLWGMASTNVPDVAASDLWAAALTQSTLGGSLTALGLHLPAINVLDGGAVGTGVTDDTAAIQAALTQASGGGRVYFPPGDYAVDTASLYAMANHAFTISGDGVTLEGAGPDATTIRLTGTTTGCSILYAQAVNHLTIRGIRFVGVGDAVATNQVLRYGNTGATADQTGLTIEDCEFTDFRYDGWLDVEAASGSYDINDVTIQRCRFLSAEGDMFSTGGSGLASDCIRIDTAGPPGYVDDVLISDCWFDCTYIKRAVALKDGVRHAVVRDCYAYGCGLDKATDSVESYGMMVYGIGCDDVEFRNCRIEKAWTCGIYGVNATNVRFIDCFISGTEDGEDSGLCVGGIAFGAAHAVQIIGCKVEDCAIGVEVQPLTLQSRVLIDGVEVAECGAKGIIVRESATYKHSGGVKIVNCSLSGSHIQIYRATGSAFLDLIDIEGCTITRGYLHVMTNTYWSRIANNTIHASDQSYGIRVGGPSLIQITGNRVSGPGAAVADSYGLYFNVAPQNPSIVANNIVTGFYSGMYAPYGATSLTGNVICDVTELVKNSVAGDLGRDAPSTIPGTVATYWSAGQVVDNLLIASAPGTPGWRCIAPADGLGCTYTTATTGDMTSGASVITGVAAIDRYIPGVALTLANAAAGPAALSTEVVSWQLTYGTLSGTFIGGEYIEGGTSKGVGTVETDNGSTTMIVTNIPYGPGAFAVGETITGHTSGATAVLSAVALVVADACGNTVDDSAMGLVAPTWATAGVQVLSGSVVWDPASLADGVGETSAGITVTGAALGDPVVVSPPYDLQDCVAIGYVQAANTVEIRLQNESAGTRDLGSGTWRVRVLKQ